MKKYSTAIVLLAATLGWHAAFCVYAAGQAPALALATSHSQAVTPRNNFDEAKVPPYTLPDPLRMADGTPVRCTEDWWGKRRPEILRLCEEQMYGRSPGRPDGMRFEVWERQAAAFGGKAVRRQVTLHFGPGKDAPKMDLLLYLPASAKGPVPVFLGYNFFGNQSVCADPGIRISTEWIAPHSSVPGIVNYHATETSRGGDAARWPVEWILRRGYGVATAYCGDVVPQSPKAGHRGVLGLIPQSPNSWATIAGWSWGLSRALDYLETDPRVDAKRVAVHGLSRLGKASLWAGARDTRFALAISACSGAGGMALSKRIFGEEVRNLVSPDHDPRWYCANFDRYAGRETELPIDQHFVAALIAPRALYASSATKDLWADPKGEFLTLVHADPVYRLLGRTGLPSRDMPPPDHPLAGGQLGYHLHTGEHEITAYDWQRYLDFADRTLHQKAP